jgi:hypothetical protein
MDRIDKLKAISTIPADSEADIALINKYSVKELTSQDVFCFSVILCDNEVDRDTERFTTASLDKLAPLFLGKSVLFDHRWSTEKQVARLYRTFVEEMSEKTVMGEPKKVLRGSAYMLKEGNAELIKAIEGGIKKEVSVGCQMEKCACSICGENFSYQWQTGKSICKNDHIKGDDYDGKMCVGDLVDPKDAYEVSFVAVPAQRGAGVTKEAKIDTMTPEEKLEMIKQLQMSLADDDERTERAKLIAENKKYLEVK